MNFIFENFKNILIIILLVVTTFIFTFDFVQTKAFENNPVSLKEKGSILAQEIEAYIPNEKNIIEIIVEQRKFKNKYWCKYIFFFWIKKDIQEKSLECLETLR